jgi:hypothetical protein
MHCASYAFRFLYAYLLTGVAGVTLSGVVGMVARHPNARAISLARWGRVVLRDSDYAALLTAVEQVGMAGVVVAGRLP